MTNDVVLTGVKLFRGVGSVLARFEFAGSTERPPGFFFGIWGRSADGQSIRQFGLNYLDGARIGYFVFDHNAAHQDNLGEIPTEDPHQVIAPFPSDPIDELGEGATFSGYLAINGVDVQKDVAVELFD